MMLSFLIILILLSCGKANGQFDRKLACPKVDCKPGCYLISNNGCLECRCDINFCEIVKCPPGTECIPNLQCNDATCPIVKCEQKSASCHCSGDPHCMTFDGAGFWDYQGTSEYILTQAVDFQPAFTVYSKNQHLWGNTQVSYVQYVRVTINNDNIHMETTAPGSSIIIVKLNNNAVILPYIASNYNVNEFHDLVRLSTNFGLVVEYTKFFSLNVILTSSLRSRVEGYCGNYNNNATDDSIDRTGKFWPDIGVQTGAALGESWVTSGQSRVSRQVIQLAVLQNCPTVRERCRQIINTNGIFNDCIKIITLPVAIKFFEICEYDADATCSDQVVCSLIEAFVKKCQSVEVVVAWREVTLCPCKCNDPNAICSSGKVSACPATCNDPLQTRPCNEIQIMDVCICKAEYVFLASVCVHKSQCSCVDENGTIRKIGEQWLSANCATLSTCKSGGVNGILSRPFECPAYTACIDGACKNPCTAAFTHNLPMIRQHVQFSWTSPLMARICKKGQECQIQCFNPRCQPARASCVIMEPPRLHPNPEKHFADAMI